MKPPKLIIGTLTGAFVGWVLVYHGGAVLGAVVGLILGLLVDLGILTLTRKPK